MHVFSSNITSLNKEESRVIFMREFEISLFQTQCLLIKDSLVLRTL
jgi:hypothetical protein